jgi:hypothetical protein
MPEKREISEEAVGGLLGFRNPCFDHGKNEFFFNIPIIGDANRFLIDNQMA